MLISSPLSRRQQPSIPHIAAPLPDERLTESLPSWHTVGPQSPFLTLPAAPGSCNGDADADSLARCAEIDTVRRWAAPGMSAPAGGSTEAHGGNGLRVGVPSLPSSSFVVGREIQRHTAGTCTRF